MRKIFIDCGAHTGSSVRYFCKTRKDWQDYEIFSFEPDPQHWKKWPVSIKINDVNGVTIGFKDFNLIKKAVWIEDCESDFYTTETNWRPEGGSTLNIEKHNHNKFKYSRKEYENYNYKFNTIKIECIDINKFIESNFSISDYIFLKMDIEGAEYDCVPHMLLNDTFEYLDEFSVEWHSWRTGRSPKPYNVHKYKSPEDLDFEKRIKDEYHLDCGFWDAIDC